jgi:thiol-disulfide isomerase/thioredoxin
MKNEVDEKDSSEMGLTMNEAVAHEGHHVKSNGRRHWLVAGVGVVAGLSGAWFAWQKFQPVGVANAAVQNFWQQEFEKPEGGALLMADLRGQPLLVNFWATWCPPCIEELPLIDAYYKTNKSNGMQVVGLAVDQPSKVRQFLSQKLLSFPVGLAGLNGTELGKTLGNIENVLPYSLMFNAKGLLVGQKLGKLTPKDLSDWLKAVK